MKFASVSDGCKTNFLVIQITVICLILHLSYNLLSCAYPGKVLRMKFLARAFRVVIKEDK